MEADLKALETGDAQAADSIPHGAALVELAEAMVSREEAQLAAARRRVLEALGAEVLVDAVAVASNFLRMVRIADATGIGLGTLEELTAEVREELRLDRFARS